MAGPRDTVAVQTQSPGPVQPGAGRPAFLGPVCLSEGGVAERRAGGPGYTRCLLEPALRVGELACSTGHPVWHGPITSAGSQPGSLRSPTQEQGV